MKMITQVLAVSSISLRSLPHRAASSAVIVVGTAGVVAVLLSVLALSTGLAGALTTTGRAVGCNSLCGLLNRLPRRHRTRVLAERVIGTGGSLQLCLLIALELGTRLGLPLRLLRRRLVLCRRLWRCRLRGARTRHSRRARRRRRQNLAQFLGIERGVTRGRDAILVGGNVRVRSARGLLQIRRQCKEGKVLILGRHGHNDCGVPANEFLDQV